MSNSILQKTSTLSLVQASLVNDINSPFVITDRSTIHFPMAPLVTAVGFVNDEQVKMIRISTTLFIDSNAGLINFTPESFITEQNPNGDLSVISCYNYKEETPESFNVYYIELDYTSETVEEIVTVTSYLRDIDPKTSRGTSTSVYWS
jgi:hypothetical protein